ncbi:MAG: sigma-54-dependent Fis family transcriptional regulator [SAR324 cluster bacterium]|nr:sigma-54-dependent Fis family transcriptional regulator [SAR324 cluster bacterium]
MSASENKATILVVDDDPAIRQAYTEIFSGSAASQPARIFPDGNATPHTNTHPDIQMIQASQGEAGVRIIEKRHQAGKPVHGVFLDVRMPPGIDGLETAKRMREIDPALQIVICTSYSDYPFETFIAQLGRPDHLYYLEKPFAPDEVLQLAQGLIEQWARQREVGAVLRHLTQQARRQAAAVREGRERANVIMETSLMEIRDLTGAVSTAIVRTGEDGEKALVKGNGLLETGRDLERARKNRLSFKTLPLTEAPAGKEGLAVILLQPQQTALFCSRVVQAMAPCLLIGDSGERPAPGTGSFGDPGSSGVDPATSPATSPAKRPAQHPVTRPAIDQESIEFHGMLSGDPGMFAFFDQIRRVAQGGVSVFISGETGTGKERVARALHLESERAAGPFISINCANLSEHLLESQLFGHRKGAFTGALQDQIGLLHAANGGTLFLDEVAEIPATVQAKLLRVLQEREYLPLGETRPVAFDARIISGSNTPLRDAVSAGDFREDLYYRLHVIPLDLSPLRERGNDATLLFTHFLRQALENRTTSSGVESFPPDISSEVWTVIRGYDWPGNVREVQNVAAYAATMWQEGALTMTHLPTDLRGAMVNQELRERWKTEWPAGNSLPASMPVEAIQKRRGGRLTKEEIERALLETGGNRSKAARRLGVSRMTLWRHLKENPDLSPR